ncbi:MAG: hypothetical protein KAU10_04375, partial [Dehalococcoidia bacterium]|nr:hypothetical protein [Dehalococcoidia bacterium]
DSPAEGEIIFSDLALPSGYCGDEADERLVYASYSSGTEADDVYRIEDSDVYRLDVDRGVGVDIASIAFSDGRLLAGEVASRADEASALLHTSFNPEDSRPDWEEPAKPPTGGFMSGCANAQVALIVGRDPETDGKRTYCYCATSTNHVDSASDWADTSLPGAWSGNAAGNPDESAFSRSEDNCAVWNQLSLIDTDVKRLCDYALWLEDDPDETDILYLASVGSGFDSIWRSTSDPLGDIWQRVLCLYTETDYAESDVIILRHTPEDSPGEAIFLAVRGNNSIQNSLDQGQTWKRVKRCPNVTDLAVVSNELLYVLDDYLVHRAIWTTRRLWDIWEWEMDIDTGLLSGYSIAFSGKDFVFVGDDGDEG